MDFRFMDRHADKSARDDRKTRNAQNLNTPQDSRICDEKPLLCKVSAEIRLGAYRTSEPKQSKVYRAKPNPKTKGGEL